jgi:hypothetical protein
MAALIMASVSLFIFSEAQSNFRKPSDLTTNPVEPIKPVFAMFM